MNERRADGSLGEPRAMPLPRMLKNKSSALDDFGVSGGVWVASDSWWPRLLRRFGIGIFVEGSYLERFGRASRSLSGIGATGNFRESDDS